MTVIMIRGMPEHDSRREPRIFMEGPEINKGEAVKISAKDGNMCRKLARMRPTSECRNVAMEEDSSRSCILYFFLRAWITVM